jgi:hypothetical protein
MIVMTIASTPSPNGSSRGVLTLRLPFCAASTSDGAQVVQWIANGGANQQWQFVPA